MIRNFCSIIQKQVIKLKNVRSLLYTYQSEEENWEWNWRIFRCRLNSVDKKRLRKFSKTEFCGKTWAKMYSRRTVYGTNILENSGKRFVSKYFLISFICFSRLVFLLNYYDSSTWCTKFWLIFFSWKVQRWWMISRFNFWIRHWVLSMTSL